MAYFRRGSLTSDGAIADVLPDSPEDAEYEAEFGRERAETIQYVPETLVDPEPNEVQVPPDLPPDLAEEQLKAMETNRFTEIFPEKYCTSKYLLVCVCLYTLVQSMTVTGLFSSTVSTIEKRYRVSSFTMGLVSSTYDLTVLLVASSVGHYGSSIRGHTPRWLAGGLTILGFGTLLYSSPQWFDNDYDAVGAEVETCTSSADFLNPDCGRGTAKILFLFFVAQVVIGIGSSPLYMLAPPYFDEVVEKKNLSMYLAVFYAFAAIGPAFGFILAGLLLDVWVDPDQAPAGLDPEDPAWVGAWWIGYVVVGLMGLLFATPMFMFPKYLPNTRHIRETNKHEAKVLKRRLKRMSVSMASASGPLNPSIWSGFRALATNPTYMFNCAAQATEAFAVSGLAAFLPKAVESIFGVDAGLAAIVVGMVVILGAAGGIFLGGAIMKWRKMSALTTARMCWIVALIAVPVLFGFFIGCSEQSLAGVTSTYPGNSLAPIGGSNDVINLQATCNTGCVNSCNADEYIPVCGSNGLNYFSSCHAGCTTTVSDSSWSNCTCVPSGPSFGDVSLGKCSSGCNALPFFLIALFFGMFFTFMNNVPATSVILRCLQPEHRALGMAIQSVSFRLLGSIPGPIIVGLIIDGTCRLKETDCGDTTEACWEYETLKLRQVFVAVAVVPKALSFMFFFLSWWFFRSIRGRKRRGSKSSMASSAGTPHSHVREMKIVEEQPEPDSADQPRLSLPDDDSQQSLRPASSGDAAEVPPTLPTTPPASP